jgi:hypothetical protein
MQTESTYTNAPAFDYQHANVLQPLRAAALALPPSADETSRRWTLTASRLGPLVTGALRLYPLGPAICRSPPADLLPDATTRREGDRAGSERQPGREGAGPGHVCHEPVNHENGRRRESTWSLCDAKYSDSR